MVQSRVETPLDVEQLLPFLSIKAVTVYGLRTMLRNNVVCYRKGGHTRTLTSTTIDKQDIPHIHTLANDIKNIEPRRAFAEIDLEARAIAMGDNATKATLFTTVSKLSERENKKKSRESNSNKNSGFRGVESVEEWEGIAMRDTEKAQKSRLFATVSKLSSEDNKNTQKSNSGKNVGKVGKVGVEEWEDTFSARTFSLLSLNKA